ncbi:DUF5908 family protein [Herbaspirillum rhizosphaerae]|uniref:DUF5908 family protein n=1 Tax=Herbaspirillum rhizosphaerae TaxID=346179 RepID=UPI00067C1F60|nr:DUF5908 family protein [Herbaspirillum rhizosphaerae]
MSIEIRQLSIRSNVIQRAGGEGTGETGATGASSSSGHKPAIGSACAGAQLDEDARNDILAECRAMVLDLLSRSRER